MQVSGGSAPDLRVVSMQDPPPSVSAGDTLEVADTTKNTGEGAAPPSVTRYYLSQDAETCAGGVALTPERAVPALAAGEQSWGTFTVTIPGSTPGGTYYMLACADGADLIPETDEGNNHYQKGPIALSGPPLESQDSDGDGCTDYEELGGDPALGGGRDPLNPWDFFDVTGDKLIDLGDAFGVLAKFGSHPSNPPGAPLYDAAYDRSTPTGGYPGPTPWLTEDPAIEGTGVELNEVFWSLASFGHSCFSAP
jgi:hypothetical protein